MSSNIRSKRPGGRGGMDETIVSNMRDANQPNLTRDIYQRMSKEREKREEEKAKARQW